MSTLPPQMGRLLLVCWNILMITCGVSTQSNQLTLGMTTFSPGCTVQMDSTTTGRGIQETRFWSINDVEVYGFICDRVKLNCIDETITQTTYTVSGNATASSPTAVKSTIFFTASKPEALTIMMAGSGETSNELHATVQLCDETHQNGVSTPPSSCTSGHFGCEVDFKCRNGTVGSSITATCTCGATWDKFISCVNDTCNIISCENCCSNNGDNLPNSLSHGHSIEVSCCDGYEGDSSQTFFCNGSAIVPKLSCNKEPCTIIGCDNCCNGTGAELPNSLAHGDSIEVGCCEGYKGNSDNFTCGNLAISPELNCVEETTNSDGDGGKNTGLNAGAIIGIIIVIIIGVFFIQIIIGIRCIDGEGCKNRGPVIRCFCIGITIGICLKDKICKKPDQNDGTGKDKNKRKAKEAGRDDSPQDLLISKSVVEEKNVRTEKDEIELKLQDGDRNDSPQC